MPKPTPDELDRQVEAILRGEVLPPAANAEVAALTALAVTLRGLPREEFRSRLSRSLRPAIAPRDLREAVKDLPPGELNRLGTLDRATIGVFRFSGAAPWERHPDGDELIVVLDGGGEITVLGEDGPICAALRPGTLFVCPRGLWHRPIATPSMTALYVTPLTDSQHSWADDPRVG